ncbi:MAG: Putative GAF sensor protein [Desulfonauticus sp. 38_4375]|jgi:transcriptional regulator with GAF, ATPase, and Fis domain|nr:MAG: Putative GAF sensor protein [Desulfonauticus sp. 38_4375]
MAKSLCLDNILSLICSVFDAYSAVLFLRQQENEYVLRSFFSLGDNILPQCTLSPGKGLVGWILKNGQPLRLSSFNRESACLGYYQGNEENKIKAFMGWPLSHNLGALCVDSKRAHSFSEKDLRILSQFAQLIELLEQNFCQIGLENKKLIFYNYLKLIWSLPRSSLKWKVFLAKLLKLMEEASGFSYVLFVARDEVGKGFFIEGCNKELSAEQEKVKYPIDYGLLGWIFREGQPVFKDKSKGEKELDILGEEGLSFKSLVCLPLVINKKTRSILVFADEKELEIEEELKEFFYLLRDYLTLFLENLYFKNRAKI